MPPEEDQRRIVECGGVATVIKSLESHCRIARLALHGVTILLRCAEIGTCTAPHRPRWQRAHVCTAPSLEKYATLLVTTGALEATQAVLAANGRRRRASSSVRQLYNDIKPHNGNSESNPRESPRESSDGEAEVEDERRAQILDAAAKLQDCLRPYAQGAGSTGSRTPTKRGSVNIEVDLALSHAAEANDEDDSALET